MTTKTELAYLAGIIDGEGYLSNMTPKTGGFRLRIRIGSTSVALIEWLQSHYGGRLEKGVRQVCTEGCSLPSPHIHSRIQHQRWVVSGQEAEILLVASLPYLVIKRDLALSLLSRSSRRKKYLDGYEGVQYDGSDGDDDYDD